jgi:hypothetical protein
LSSGDAWAGSFGSNLDTSSSAVRVEKFGLRLDIDPDLLLLGPTFIKRHNPTPYRSGVPTSSIAHWSQPITTEEYINNEDFSEDGTATY